MHEALARRVLALLPPRVHSKPTPRPRPCPLTALLARKAHAQLRRDRDAAVRTRMPRVRAPRGPAARAQVEHAHVVEPHVVEVLPADDDEPVRRHAREVRVARARGECVRLGLGLMSGWMGEAVEELRRRRRRHGAQMRLSVLQRPVLRSHNRISLLIRREPAAAGEVEEADVVEHAEVVCARGVGPVSHPAEHDEVVVPCRAVVRKCRLRIREEAGFSARAPKKKEMKRERPPE